MQIGCCRHIALQKKQRDDEILHRHRRNHEKKGHSQFTISMLRFGEVCVASDCVYCKEGACTMYNLSAEINGKSWCSANYTPNRKKGHVQFTISLLEMVQFLMQ
jgi:hypothetical protein